jgi:hypothetical protein
MKKTLKIIGIAIILLAAIIYGVRSYMIYQTKKASPEEKVSYIKNDTKLEVFYNRPYKKGREIFGKLVPYDIIWRTGANEATTFESNRDLIISGKTLPKGKYTLWTIPSSNNWKVIFNEDMYIWGVSTDGKASRDPEADVIIVTVPVNSLDNPIEQFTISFKENSNGLDLQLFWDKTLISVPLTIK